jgi:predicted outer membrane repeat protein
MTLTTRILTIGLVALAAACGPKEDPPKNNAADAGNGDMTDEASCDDGVQNGDETDVDCGGSCDPCGEGAACVEDDDCENGTCLDDRCATPSCGDGLVNQDSEICDAGEENGPGGDCSEDCSQKLCRLGEDVDTIDEAIDDMSCLGVWLPNGEHGANLELARPFRIVGESTDANLSLASSGSIVTTSAEYLELRTLTLWGGQADRGGAVFALREESEENGRLLIDGVVFESNGAVFSGGAVSAEGYDVEVAGTTFDQNTVLGIGADGEGSAGGGLYVKRGDLQISDSRFEANEASIEAGALAAVMGGGLAVLDGDATLTNVDFVNNRAVASPDATPGGALAFGGALGLGIGSLTVQGGEVTGNEARAITTMTAEYTRADGGGFYVGEAEATISDAVFRNNALVCESATTVRCRGGALNLVNETATLENLTVEDNSIDVTGANREDDDYTVGGGAGLAAFGEGVTTVTNSTFRGNTVTSDIGQQALAWGGGILVGGERDGAAVYVDRCTLFENGVTTDAGSLSLAAGGGLAVNARKFETDAYVVNSTVSTNTVEATGPMGTTLATGAGIVIEKDPDVTRAGLSVRSSTIVGNEAGATGGGISTGGSTAGTEANITNSIIIGNSADSDPDCTGTVLTSLGFNLLSNTTDCVRSGATDMDVIDDTAMVGPLGPYDGDTWTHGIDAASPAIDAGDPSGCTDNTGAQLTIDQRGMPRDDGACDIGAFELQQ